jgi:asparagine synthase (glutamine-hydrolysing)
MAVSLETRAPFLDADLYEYSWTLPLDRKIRNGHGKWILKEIVYSHLPRELMNRPKQGFGVPIDRWLRGPLYDWAESLLDEKRLTSEGFLDAKEVRSLWHRHCSGRENLQHQLWNILMFQAWLERQDSQPL